MATMDMNKYHIPYPKDLGQKEDMLKNKEVDMMVADWDPTIPKSYISQQTEFRSTPKNRKRKSKGPQKLWSQRDKGWK